MCLEVRWEVTALRLPASWPDLNLEAVARLFGLPEESGLKSRVANRTASTILTTEVYSNPVEPEATFSATGLRSHATGRVDCRASAYSCRRSMNISSPAKSGSPRPGEKSNIVDSQWRAGTGVSEMERINWKAARG